MMHWNKARQFWGCWYGHHAKSVVLPKLSRVYVSICVFKIKNIVIKLKHQIIIIPTNITGAKDEKGTGSDQSYYSYMYDLRYAFRVSLGGIDSTSTERIILYYCILLLLSFIAITTTTCATSDMLMHSLCA
jgi:hypothetical protein